MRRSCRQEEAPRPPGGISEATDWAKKWQACGMKDKDTIREYMEGISRKSNIGSFTGTKEIE